ncbi:uncharacterized protein LOC121877405 [Homarus americanus]|nr:uncharacterized protein LOC121877405 [Homarus americanus]
MRSAQAFSPVEMLYDTNKKLYITTIRLKLPAGRWDLHLQVKMDEEKAEIHLHGDSNTFKNLVINNDCTFSYPWPTNSSTLEIYLDVTLKDRRLKVGSQSRLQNLEPYSCPSRLSVKSLKQSVKLTLQSADNIEAYSCPCNDTRKEGLCANLTIPSTSTNEPILSTSTNEPGKGNDGGYYILYIVLPLVTAVVLMMVLYLCVYFHRLTGGFICFCCRRDSQPTHPASNSTTHQQASSHPRLQSNDIFPCTNQMLTQDRLPQRPQIPVENLPRGSFLERTEPFQPKVIQSSVENCYHESLNSLYEAF